MLSIKELNKICKENNKRIIIKKGIITGYMYEDYSWYFGGE